MHLRIKVLHLGAVHPFDAKVYGANSMDVLELMGQTAAMLLAAKGRSSTAVSLPASQTWAAKAIRMCALVTNGKGAICGAAGSCISRDGS